MHLCAVRALCSCRQGNYDAFLDIMHQKFLNGDDKGADYAAIDNDASLDFSREAQHDAEDAYFGE